MRRRYSSKIIQLYERKRSYLYTELFDDAKSQGCPSYSNTLNCEGIRAKDARIAKM
jgi:hypothetical protein